MRQVPEKYFYILLSFVIATFLFFYFSEASLCPLLRDDHWFHDIFTKNGFTKSYVLLYSEINGRWFSNLAELLFLYPVLFWFPGLFLVRVLILLLFIRGLELFISEFIYNRFRKTMSDTLVRLIAIFCTALLFFVFWEGRVEVWFWLSSLCSHLLSLSLMLWLFGFLLKENARTIEKCMIVFISAVLGGMSETYALMCLLLLLIFFLKGMTSLRRTVLPFTVMLLSVLLNVCSPGARARLGVLPDVDILQALKNSIHSMLLPVIAFYYIPLKLLIVSLAVLFGRLLRDKLGLADSPISLRHFLPELLLVLALIFVSYFIPCLLLSDIVADRMQSFAYLLFLLFVFYVALRLRSKELRG
jgi:hypothetical protein